MNTMPHPPLRHVPTDRKALSVSLLLGGALAARTDGLVVELQWRPSCDTPNAPSAGQDWITKLPRSFVFSQKDSAWKLVFDRQDTDVGPFDVKMRFGEKSGAESVGADSWSGWFHYKIVLPPPASPDVNQLRPATVTAQSSPNSSSSSQPSPTSLVNGERSQSRLGDVSDDVVKTKSSGGPSELATKAAAASGAAGNGDGAPAGSLPVAGMASAATSLKAPLSGDELQRGNSYKLKRSEYKVEKRRVAQEMLTNIKDPSVVILQNWLKIRTILKSWTRFYCVLRPAALVIYKKKHRQGGSHWVGTVLLPSCSLIERPSKKDGFCFKLFHPLEQSIWASKGPKGELVGSVTTPLPYPYLIFRAPSEQEGKVWMDALELALRCADHVSRGMAANQLAALQTTSPPTEYRTLSGSLDLGPREISLLKSEAAAVDGLSPAVILPGQNGVDVSYCERHFEGVDEEGVRVDEANTSSVAESDDDDPHSDDAAPNSAATLQRAAPPLDATERAFVDATTYVPPAKPEELGQLGDACQTEEVGEENKSIIWSLLKQVKPGMDLSKVVLPTFILEPRSLLDKFSDYYYHADLLAEAAFDPDPYSRMRKVVRWYISGFYKKPRGLKKPYNPIIGETFRCCWPHRNGSTTFYMAEQISHHPPISAIYVANRPEGFVVQATVLARSKFYGNSVSAIMDGVGRLTLLNYGEDYLITMPYAHCKGILIGTLSMELGGKVTIECTKTGYSAELNFRLKGLFGGGSNTNRIDGKMRLGSQVLSSISGHWDGQVFIKHKSEESGEGSLFWEPSSDIRAKRLVRHVVPLTMQRDFESERLWQHVGRAIVAGDQEKATYEKWVLEEAQRQGARERKLKGEEWVPKFFELDVATDQWCYKYADTRPWDANNDLRQFEIEFQIRTLQKHPTLVCQRVNRSLSQSSRGAVESPQDSPLLAARSRHSSRSSARSPPHASPRPPPRRVPAATLDPNPPQPLDDLASSNLGARLEVLAAEQRQMRLLLQQLQAQLAGINSRLQRRADNSGSGITQILFGAVIAVLAVLLFQWLL